VTPSLRPHPFNADRPITKRDEDILGRSDFAQSLADAIRTWKEHDSLVIGLFGQWGQGKTSLKNLILDSLKNQGDTTPFIVQFNPWQWSSQSQIAEAFFSDIATVQGGKNRGKDSEERAAKWRQYAALLSFGENTAAGLKSAMTITVGLLAIAFFGAAFVIHPAVQFVLGVMGVVLGIIAGSLKCFSGLAESLARFFEERTRHISKSLDQVRIELRDLMMKLDRPILVVIDDIDRLTPEEIRLVFQLVKSNADFPNMVYLLMFQRDIVEKALQRGAVDAPTLCGRDYLEKIISVGFDLPLVEPFKVQAYFLNRLNMMLEGISIKQSDVDRFTGLFHESLKQFLLDLRDAKRLLSSLEFHLNLLQSKGTLEVNPTDLIALEVLRVFEPGVHAALPGLHGYLTARGRRSNSEDQKEAKAAIDSALAKCSSDLAQGRVLALFKGLFPQVESLYENFASGGDSLGQWCVDLRVCHPEMFNRYFLFRVADGDVSQADINRVLALAGDRAGLLAEFRAFNKQGLLLLLLDRLESYMKEIPLQHAVPFVTALYDIGEELPEEKPGMLSVSPVFQIHVIIYWYLKREPDLKKRAHILIEATKATTGLVMPVTDAFSEDRERAKQEPREDEYLVDRESSELLKCLCLEKIRKASEDGTLLSNRYLASNLARWRQWASPDEPSAWLAKQIETADGVLAVLVGFMSRSTSQTSGSYVPEKHWNCDIHGLEQYITVDILEQKISGLSISILNAEQQRAVNCFVRALKRKRQGKPYRLDQMWRGDEEE